MIIVIEETELKLLWVYEQLIDINGLEISSGRIKNCLDAYFFKLFFVHVADPHEDASIGFFWSQSKLWTVFISFLLNLVVDVLVLQFN